MQPLKPKSDTKCCLLLLVLGLLIAGRCICCHEDVVSKQHRKPASAGAAGVADHGVGRIPQSAAAGAAAAVVVVEAAAAAAAQHRVASRPALHADADVMHEVRSSLYRSQHRRKDDHTVDSSSRKDSRHRQQYTARLQSLDGHEISKDINADRRAKTHDSSGGNRSRRDRLDRHRQHVSAHTVHRAALGRQPDDQQQQVEQPKMHDHSSTKHSRHREHSTAQHQHASVQQSISAQPGANLLEDPLADSHLLQWLAANGAAGSVDHLITTPKHLPTKAATPAAKAKAKSNKAKLQSPEAEAEAAAAAAAGHKEGQRLAWHAESQKQHWQNDPFNHASASSHSSSDRRDVHEPKQVGGHASKPASAGYAGRAQASSPVATTAVPASLMQTAVVHRRSMQETPACRQGQVSQIRCWLDADGYITALAVESEDGITTPAVCAAQGLQTDGGSLQEAESVVEIISCRSASGGVSYMEFHTDRLRKYPITCGSGMPLRADAPTSESTAVECEGLAQAQFAAEPAARRVTVASMLSTRKQRKPADSPASQEAYPIQGLRASCNARQQLAAFKNTCLADSPGSSHQPEPTNT